eukprot:gb/GEZN01001437.1/.p1 GENE.gb/GEZN01001437.1/~~gb/GEZN01001437.1/.p1  ORF type:complete len:837 (-),score=141.79 gb/GEZN01001437.1/:524-3034(-)
MSSSPIAFWEKLDNRLYNKILLYDMLWKEADLEKYLIAAAPFGGPIALRLDERKVMLMGGGVSEAEIRVFSSSGKRICAFPFKDKGLLQMGWTEREELVCVQEDGTIQMFDLHGNRTGRYSMGEECQEDGVSECIIWSKGLVCRTAMGKSQLWAVLDFEKFKPVKLADPKTAGLTQTPTAMCIIPPDNDGGDLEVFLATASKSIIVVDRKEASNLRLDQGPFNRMVISPAAELIACFNDQGTLWVMSTDFEKTLSKFNTKSKVPPKDLVWCGESAVVLYWEKMLLMVGGRGGFVKYSYDTDLFLVSEEDGVRILTAQTCELLQRVPDSVESIFRPGSQTFPSQLLDASKAFDNRSVEAEKNMRNIKSANQLDNAIDVCLDAAMHMFDTVHQTRLLKAASYGKLFSTTFQPDKFVDLCRILRVLNAVRDSSVGMPLTYHQYGKLQAQVVIDRLVNRYHHLLALRICEFVRIPPERVLTHWAREKIKAADLETDDELAELIVGKLATCPGISFAAIAATANDKGRTHLATQLLEREPRAVDQVPLLIDMNEDVVALDKSIASSDTDLVYLALLHIKKTRGDGEFFTIVNSRPLARNLWISYCKQCNLAELKVFYQHLQRPQEAAYTMALQAYQCTQFRERVESLEVAKAAFALDKGGDLLPGAVVADQVELLKAEVKMEKELRDSSTPTSFIDLSMAQVVERYIELGLSRKAQQFGKKMKMSQKQMWHIEVRTLAKNRQWMELDKLVANKKVPPIGFGPFIEACVEYKQLEHAARFISRLPDPTEQMEWFCNIGLWKQAVSVAQETKDQEAMLVIRSRCRDRTLLPQIDSWLRNKDKS